MRFACFALESRKPWAVGALSLALSVAVSAAAPVLAAPGDVNSVNNVTHVVGGTYYNTPGAETVFQGTGLGLRVEAGVTVRGLEVSNPASPATSLTNNGGSLRFSAPGQVIRIDGTIDASAIKGGSLYLGDGGRISFDAAFLYQNGKIYANGARGGQVSIDVGSLTQTSSGRIQAMGTTGEGGQITLSARDVVDLRQGSIVDARGHVIGLVNPALIRIEGALVNVDGLVRANGVQSAGVGGHGGTIRLTASGDTQSTLDGLATSAFFSNSQKTSLQNRHAQLISAGDGDVRLGSQGKLEANGSSGAAAEAGRAGRGGAIILNAIEDIAILGSAQANGGAGKSSANPVSGGTGGTLTLQALGAIDNQGQLQALGGRGGDNTFKGTTGDTRPYAGANGGAGGDILVQYGDGMIQGPGGAMLANGGAGGHSYAHAKAFNTNSQPAGPLAIATLVAYGANGGSGGAGGRVIFDGPANPTGAGTVSAKGGQGGNAGNAEATVRAIASPVNGVALAKGWVILGQGGTGGAAGAVFAPEPTTFSLAYTAGSGAAGADGKGQVNAYATGAQATAQAQIRERFLSLTQPNSATRILGYWPAAGVGPGPNPLPGNVGTLSLPTPPVFGGASGRGGGSDTDPLFSFRDEAALLVAAERRLKIEPPRTGSPRLGPLITYGQPTMFLAKTYESLTELILKSADAQYQALRARGESDERARQAVQQLLSDQGVDAAMAAGLTKAIENGTLHASEAILGILTAMKQTAPSA